MDEELESWRMIRGRTAMLYKKLEELRLVMESRRGAVVVCRRGSSRLKTRSSAGPS